MIPGRSYRADIDGLRAVAVLAVIGYHFFPQWVPAGFVGVDVFFVISGFLITGIIRQKVEEGRFSLVDFYARRIRRIFPALAIVLAFVAAVGWKLLYRDEYRMVGNHVAAGAGFATNILLWLETGYFDAAAEAKPLLHLWSLGVEEQFYLVWPLVLACLCRSSRSRFWAVLGIFGASLAACIAFTPSYPVAAFYLPVFRFWELMAGAAFAVHPQWVATTQGDADARSLAGVALLAGSIALIEPGGTFPGWRALLPVAGTCLLVSAGANAIVNRTVFSWRAVVFVGLISYPLYLWHWPLLSLLRIANNDAPLTLARGGALFAISVVLAWLTYVLVEKHVRQGPKLGWKASAAAAVMVVVGIAGFVISSNNGYAVRKVNARDPTFASRDGRNATDVRAWLVDDCRLPPQEAKLFRRCTRDARGPERFALIGDSKAEAVFHGLVRTSSDQGRWMFIGGATGHDAVLPVLTDSPTFGPYKQPSMVALRALEENRNVETVVVAAATRSLFHLRNAWSIDDLPASPFYEDTLEAVVPYVKRLLAAGKKVVFLVDNPTFPDPTRCMKDARVSTHGKLGKFFAIGVPDGHCEISLARQEELAAKYRRFLEAVRKTAPNRIALFESAPYLCDMAAGRCGVFEGDLFLYSFADHISDAASTRIGKGLNEFLLQYRGADSSSYKSL